MSAKTLDNNVLDGVFERTPDVMPPEAVASVQIPGGVKTYSLGEVSDCGHALLPLVVPAGTGQLVELGDHRGWVKVSSANNNNAFLLAELEVDPQGGTPLHIHTLEDETFLIIEGRFRFQVGCNTFEVGPGDTVFAPRNIAHNWRCISETGGRAHVLITPGANFESFALEMAEHQVTPLSENSIEQLVAIAERHGLEILRSEN